jgi:adenylate kinase family enzyme
VKRVALIATASGSGKSTAGRALAQRLGAPYYELDALHHVGPNWQEATAEELLAKVEPIVATETWVIDGTYRGKIGDIVPKSADVVVWLDLPLRIWLPRLVRRTFRRLVTREELWNGNHERWRDLVHPTNSIVIYTLRHFRETRRTLEAELTPFRVVRLRTTAEVDEFLRNAARET